jgi:hypothetical protein
MYRIEKDMTAYDSNDDEDKSIPEMMPYPLAIDPPNISENNKECVTFIKTVHRNQNKAKCQELLSTLLKKLVVE